MWKSIYKSPRTDYILLLIYAIISAFHIVNYQLGYFETRVNSIATNLMFIQIIIPIFLFRDIIFTDSSKSKHLGYALVLVSLMALLYSYSSAIIVVQSVHALAIIYFLYNMTKLLSKIHDNAMGNK